METEKISIVVPAYNTAPWLPRTLESLLSQTHENLEIIVVNDGSGDDTRAVLDAFAAREDRIRAIHKENGGVTSARLAGIAAATGEWIGFVDGDDTVEQQMFAHLLKNAKETGADISHCGHRVLFPDGRVEMVHGTGDKRRQDRLTGIRELLDGGQIESSLCTKLFRRKLFENLEELYALLYRRGSVSDHRTALPGPELRKHVPGRRNLLSAHRPSVASNAVKTGIVGEENSVSRTAVGESAPR